MVKFLLMRLLLVMHMVGIVGCNSTKDIPRTHVPIFEKVTAKAPTLSNPNEQLETDKKIAVGLVNKMLSNRIENEFPGFAISHTNSENTEIHRIPGTNNLHIEGLIAPSIVTIDGAATAPLFEYEATVTKDNEGRLQLLAEDLSIDFD